MPLSPLTKIKSFNIDSTTEFEFSNLVAGNVQAATITSNSAVNVTVSGTTTLSVDSANVNVSGNLVPTANAVYSIGGPDMWWDKLYLTGNTIYLGGAALKADSESGAITIIPPVTADNPNPVATIISNTGGITVANTVGGIISQAAISNAANNASTANVAEYLPTHTGNISSNNIAVTGIITAPTAASGTSTTQLATTEFVQTEVANLIDAAPGTLDTLNELAAALNDDANFATNIATVITTANTNMKSYVDNQISTANSTIVTANTNMLSYVDNQISTTSSDIATANTNMKSYVDNQISTANSTIVTANTNMLSYVDNQISTIVTANTNMKSYVDNQISTTSSDIATANTNMKSYVDNQISTTSSDIATANTNMLSYVDNQISTIVTANTNMKSYVDNQISTTSSDIATANTNMLSYVDNQISTTSSDIATANTNMKSYVDNQISTVNSSITAANSALKTYTDSELSSKASLNSPTFTGIPGAPTAVSGTNTTQIATTAFVQTTVADLIDAAPGTLDTLNELAAALGDDANFASNITSTVTAANTNMKSYVDNQISTANSTIVTANTNMLSYVDNQISTANANMLSYVDNEISTANTNMLSYVDNQISTVNSSIATANSALKTYTDTQLDTKANLSSATFIGALSANANVAINNRGEIQLFDGDSSNYIGFRAATTVAANITWTLPAVDGSPGQALVTDGAKNLSWATASGGGGASGYQNSTITTAPGASDDYDLAKGVDQTAAVETPFDSGASDPFGVSLGIVYDCMEPVGTLVTIDYGDGEAYVAA